jgi:mRNA-degrading endonuclease toxin of MazEF toxin-antitoxin module
LPVHREDLERGTVCIGLYPYSLGFPLQEVIRKSVDAAEASLEEHSSIEEFEQTIEPSDVPEVAVQLKLRRILLLQDGRHAGRPSIVVAQISSLKDKQRAREAWYRRLVENKIPYLYRLTEQHQGVTTESVVNLTNLSTVNRDTLLRWTGKLSEAEMRVISEKLIDTLELDISGRLAALHDS